MPANGKDGAKTHRPCLVTKSELARRVGRSPAVITAITQGALCNVVQHGLVDVAHPDLVAYAELQWNASRAQLMGSDLDESPRIVAMPGVGELDLADVEQMRLSEIRERWGSLPNFKAWLDARHVLETIRAKQLKNQEIEGKLIPRALVRTHVIGVVDGTNRRLLQDGPKTITKRIYALAQSGQPIEHAEKVVRDFISSQLRPVRDKVVRVLGPEDDAASDG